MSIERNKKVKCQMDYFHPKTIAVLEVTMSINMCVCVVRVFVHVCVCVCACVWSTLIGEHVHCMI